MASFDGNVRLQSQRLVTSRTDLTLFDFPRMSWETLSVETFVLTALVRQVVMAALRGIPRPCLLFYVCH